MNTPASVNTRIKVRLIGFSRMGLFYLNKVLKARIPFIDLNDISARKFEKFGILQQLESTMHSKKKACFFILFVFIV